MFLKQKFSSMTLNAIQNEDQRPEWIVYYTGQLHFKVNDFHL